MIVVDASLIAAAVFDEEHTAFAQSLLGKHRDLLAPDLIAWELGNIAWKKVRRGYLAAEALHDFNDIVNAFEIHLLPSRDVAGPGDLAFLGQSHDLSAYDAAYFEVAARRDLPIATADKGLSRAAVRAGLNVHSPFA